MQYILINTENQRTLGLFFNKSVNKQPIYCYVNNETFNKMYVTADWLSDDVNNKKGKNSIFYVNLKYINQFNFDVWTDALSAGRPETENKAIQATSK